MIIIRTTTKVCICTVGVSYIDAVNMAVEANIPSVRHGRIIIVRIFDSRVIMRRRSSPPQHVQQGRPVRAFLPQRRIGIGVAIRAIQHAGARPTGHESTIRDACIPARRYYWVKTCIVGIEFPCQVSAVRDLTSIRAGQLPQAVSDIGIVSAPIPPPPVRLVSGQSGETGMTLEAHLVFAFGLYEPVIQSRRP